MFELTPHFNEKDRKPLYIQLYDYIIKEIEAGKIPEKTRLPSIRKLAEYLNVSRTTVDAAYQQLIAEGYIVSKPKSGFFVAEFEEQLSIPCRNDSSLFNRDKPYKLMEKKIRYDFRHGNIDQDSFPFAIWKKLENQVLYEKNIAFYGEQQGEHELRVDLSNYLYQSRGVSCSPDQIIIGGGIQQLLSLFCLILREDVHSISFENPGYDGAREIFKLHGYQVVPIDVNHHGIHLETLENSNARLVYVTPSHQFPLGYIMPIANRKKLIQWAQKIDGFIIEDDYDSEFRYKGKPIPALQGLDTHDRVIYLGTFSKSLLPSLRLAYMVLPKPFIKKFQMKFQIYEQTVSKFHQKTLHLFMQEGYWEKHLRKMKHVYQKKHEVLIKSIHQYMGSHAKIIGENSGLHIILEVKSNHTEAFLLNAAEDAGIKVDATSKYWINKSPSQYPQILIGFGKLSELEIEQGIKMLSEIWFH